MVSQRTVRSLGVVMHPSNFDDHLGLLERVENLPVEQFGPEADIEALDASVFPKALMSDKANGSLTGNQVQARL